MFESKLMSFHWGGENKSVFFNVWKGCLEAQGIDFIVYLQVEIGRNCSKSDFGFIDGKDFYLSVLVIMMCLDLGI